MQRDTPYLSVFSPNAGKYRPENSKTDTFYTVKRESQLYMTGKNVDKSSINLVHKLVRLYTGWLILNKTIYKTVPCFGNFMETFWNFITF